MALAYTMVSEAGASVYSASPVARAEFPDLDVTARGTISIARRLQDPLAELVKVPPQSVGVGLYQHDVDEKRLAGALDRVVESAVNFAGVDANTASAALARPRGRRQQTRGRERSSAYRNANGPFPSRREFLKVAGLGPGHVHAGGRLPEGARQRQPARRYLYPPRELRGDRAPDRLDAGATAEARAWPSAPPGSARPCAADAPSGATWPPRSGWVSRPCSTCWRTWPSRGSTRAAELPPPLLRRDVLSLDDLHEGMMLRGTVRNVVDFGAFVDIGLKNDGLVHRSELGPRFVRDPLEVVSVGDVVSVRVLARSTRSAGASR